MVEAIQKSQPATKAPRMTKAEKHAAFVVYLKEALYRIHDKGETLYKIEMERWKSPSGNYYSNGLRAAIMIENPSERLRKAFKETKIFKTGKRGQWCWCDRKLEAGEYAHELMAAQLQALFPGEGRFYSHVTYFD